MQGKTVLNRIWDNLNYIKKKKEEKKKQTNFRYVIYYRETLELWARCILWISICACVENEQLLHII